MSAASLRSRGQRPWWRVHGLFVVVLLAGIAVRATVMFAYRPVLLFADSFGYLLHVEPFHLQWQRPGGYLFFLWPILHLTDSQYPVAFLQHAMCVGLAVALYAFLLRRGLPTWGAALALLPLLFDPLQLVLEQYLLSDSLFEVLLVASCLVLLWNPHPGVKAMLASGLLMAGATLTRGVGTFLIVLFVVALISLRVGWRKLLIFLLAAVIPLTAYAVAFQRQYGEYTLTLAGPRFLYARLAPIVHCDAIKLPEYEKALCPAGPVRDRKVINWYIWGHGKAPQWKVQPPPGMTQLQMVKDYDKRVVRNQPWVLGRSTLEQFGYGFSPVRTTEIPGNPSRDWIFEDHYWTMDKLIEHGFLPPSARKGTSYDPRTAAFMASYGRWVYTPGPAMALLALLGLAAVLGFGRARWSGDRVATGLLLFGCLLPLATAAAVSGFSWRYQLPQFAMIPIAGALGLAALVRGRAPGRWVDPPVHVLESTSAAVLRLPMPTSVARLLASARDTGLLQIALAVTAGVAAGTASGAAVAVSGWSNQPHAMLGGALVGVATSGVLLLARSHCARR